MIIYVDGSFTRLAGRTFIHSWGVVALHNDSMVELHGARKLHDFQQFAGSYELLAFIEGYLYAKSHGYKNEDISFYSDDESVVYAGIWGDANNFGQKDRYEKVMSKVKHICDFYYPQLKDLPNQIAECFAQSRFNKVKGHAKCIYNLRVDFLAKFSRDQILGKETSLEGFDQWIKQGFMKFVENAQSVRWFPHFC